MGNSHDKPKPLRKALSVPNTHELPPDAPVLMKEKSRSSQRLNAPPGKHSKAGKSGKKSKHGHAAPEPDPQIPYTDAVFLPEFPLRGDIENLDFDVIDVIAKGAYGNVIKVEREDEKRFYAVKVLDKAQILHDGAINQCKDEASIQSKAGNHPFVVKAYEYWQSQRSLFIVLDYIPHGDMFTLWTFHGCFPEELVKLYIAEMTMVIDYLHESSVIYRDVKMENILFDPRGHIQMTDFGLAKKLQRGDQTRTVCGTLQYMAPEVLSVYPYGHPADWWSVGVLMYAMLVGQYPVDGVDTHTKMAQKVFECDYLLPGNISNSAQDVINRILTKSPHKRLCDIDRLQDLYFFRDLVFSDLIDHKINPMDVVPPDFFPMTGVSWAPQALTREHQMQFDKFDDTNERVAMGTHPDEDDRRYSEGYDSYHRRESDSYYDQDHHRYSDNYDDDRQRRPSHSDSYDSYRQERLRDYPRNQDYDTGHQNRRSSDTSYQQQHYYPENGYDEAPPSHRDQQKHRTHHDREEKRRQSHDSTLSDSQSYSSNTRPHSYHQSKLPYDAIRGGPDSKLDGAKNASDRERFDSRASSDRDSVNNRYGSASREATRTPPQEYMAPSQGFISERQRSKSMGEGLSNPAMYMSMDGRQSGTFSHHQSDFGDSRASARHSAHASEYMPPSLPRNPPPATLSSASSASNPPPMTLNSGVKFADPAPTITLPASPSVQQRSSNNNNNSGGVSFYTDVKGRPKVKTQQSVNPPSASAADINDFRCVEEAQIQLVTSPVVKSPPAHFQQQQPKPQLHPQQQQQQLGTEKPKIPPVPPPKPAIVKQPVKTSKIAPVPAVRKSFNAKKKFVPVDNNNSQLTSSSPSTANMTPIIATTNSSSSRDGAPFSYVPAASVNVDDGNSGSHVASPPGNVNPDRPRPVPRPRPRQALNKLGVSPDSENSSNGTARAVPPNRMSFGSRQEVRGSSLTSPDDDDSCQWNLPTSSVPSFV